MISVKNLSLKALESAFVELGEPAYRARQLFIWLYRKDAVSFDQMTNLNKGLRERLSARFEIDNARIDQDRVSLDGTRKFLHRLDDGKFIESVIIFEGRRRTLCVSTQAGCKMGCKMCATATMGFLRHLSPGEILNQVLHANRLLGESRRLTNLVFMGMGEPLDNFDNLMAALRVIHSEIGVCLGPGKVTISTVGLVDGIRRLGEEGMGEGLAISLHASDDETRQRLIPPARKFPIAELVAEAGRYGRKFRDKVTFEYVMIRGVNCGPGDGRRLAGLLSGVPAKINLIPYNEVPGLGFERPTREEIDAFKRPLLASKLLVTERKTKGRDIGAACGQLCVEPSTPKTSPG